MSLALDGNPQYATNNAASGLSISLTTSSGDDVIIAAFNLFNESTSGFISISDVAGLIWNQRSGTPITNPSNKTQANLHVYWAHASGALTGDTITVNRGTANYGSLLVWGINGANFTTPFDGLPTTASGAGTISTIS